MHDQILVSEFMRSFDTDLSMVKIPHRVATYIHTYIYVSSVIKHSKVLSFYLFWQV